LAHGDRVCGHNTGRLHPAQNALRDLCRLVNRPGKPSWTAQAASWQVDEADRVVRLAHGVVELCRIVLLQLGGAPLVRTHAPVGDDELAEHVQ